MAEREYIIPYSMEVRKRHYHKTLKGKVERFVVQLKKEELFLSFEDALTLADEDIDDNWEDYRRKFLERGKI